MHAKGLPCTVSLPTWVLTARAGVGNRSNGTYDKRKDERADSITDVRRDVVRELLNGGQESLQLVELSLHGARVTTTTATTARRRRRRRRRHRRGRYDGGAAARRPRLAARRTRRRRPVRRRRGPVGPATRHGAWRLGGRGVSWLRCTPHTELVQLSPVHTSRNDVKTTDNLYHFITTIKSNATKLPVASKLLLVWTGF